MFINNKFQPLYLFGIVWISFCLAPLSAELKISELQQILEDKCIRCHGKAGKKVKGKVNLVDLLKSPSKHSEIWLDAYKQIKQGDMPPEDETQLTDIEKQMLLSTLKKMASKSTTTVSERILTPIEIKNTMVDLLQINEKDYNPFKTLNNSYSHKTYYTMQRNMLTPYYLKQAYHVLSDSLQSFVSTKPQLEKMKIKLQFPNEPHRVHNFGSIVDLRWPRQQMYNRIIFSNPSVEKKKKNKKSKKKSSLNQSIAQALNRFSLPPGTYKLKFTAQSLNLDLSKLDKKTFGPSVRSRYQKDLNKIKNLEKGLSIDFYMAPPNDADAFATTRHIGQVQVNPRQQKEYIFVFTLQRRSAINFALRTTFLSDGATAKLMLKDQGKNERKDVERVLKNVLRIKNYQLPMIRFTKLAIEGPLNVKQSKLSFGKNEKPSSTTIATKLKTLQASQGLLNSTAYSTIFRELLRNKFATEEAYRNAMILFLISPKFLSINDNRQNLRDFIRFSSYTLHKSSPDKEFVQQYLAAKKSTDAGKFAQYLIKDKNFRRFTNTFSYQWLQLGEITNAEPDPVKFKIYHKKKLGELQRIELELYILNLFRENRPITELVKSNYSFLNDNLESFYKGNLRLDGAITVNEKSFKKKTLTNTRGGLLSMGAFLTATGNGVDPLPIKRATWISENLIDSPLPPPPDDIDLTTFEIAHADTLKKRLALHTEQPSCKNCHKRIDPLAIIMDRYNTIGGYNKKYSADSVVINNTTIKNVTDLKSHLSSNSTALARSFCRQLLKFILGRNLDIHDEGKLDAIIKDNKNSGYLCGNLYESIIKYYFF
jgi:hypothetical protein